MRKAFSSIMEQCAADDERIVFITGDLGYNALENLSSGMAQRFINAGVAEQNMIGVAAGMAYKGFKVFCYSIAPFIVYRCLEQFRNDVCLHNLPVFIVGNGGGYGYGIMGSTHHALEDIGTLSGLQNVTCYVPAFTEEVDLAVQSMRAEMKPAYLRLGADVPLPTGAQPVDSHFRFCSVAEDPGITIVVMGPVVKNVFDGLEKIAGLGQADVFTAFTFPILQLSPALRNSIERTKRLLVVEEHMPTGGLAQQLSSILLGAGLQLEKFHSIHAAGYPDGTYGDPSFHQTQSGMSAVQIADTVVAMTGKK
ncbi:MAG: transketolase [Bacteroidota bacterium]